MSASPTLRLQALAGVVVATGCALALPIQSAVGLPLVEALILVGPLVVTPLAIEAAARPLGPYGPHRLVRALRWTGPLAALALVPAMCTAPGATSGALCLPWLGHALLVALLGLHRLGRRGDARPAELAIDAGLLYLVVGASWLTASRAGWEPMGFDAMITALTGAHFHFAGLAAPVIVGQLGRLPGGDGRAYAAGAYLVAATPILVAIGITASPLLEVVTAAILALTVALVALLYVTRILPASWRARPRAHDRALLLLLAPAQLVSLWTMTLALLYALHEYTGAPLVDQLAAWLPIPAMVRGHGLLNALGFAVPSMACLAALAPPSTCRAQWIPFGRLDGGPRVGPDAFARAGVERGPAEGFYTDLGAFVDGATIHPDVALFYERTEGLALVCRPRWRPLFALPGRLAIAAGAAIGQLVLPAGRRQRVIDSRLVALDADAAGLDDAVGSIRTYRDAGAMYVACYAAHERDGVRYMNIHLPLPGGALQSNLRARALDDAGDGRGAGLELTSIRRGPTGDEGIWWRVGDLALRLPLSETLVAWPADSPRAADLGVEPPPGAVMAARHVFRLFGLVCLELDYAIGPTAWAEGI